VFPGANQRVRGASDGPELAGDAPAWRWRVASQAVHPMYVLRWLLGDVARVSCLFATP